MCPAQVRVSSMLFLLGMILSCGGCAGKGAPPPLEVPSAQVRLTHFAGTAISGPQPAAADAERADEALGVNISVLAMEAPPPPTWALLGPAARLIHATSDGKAVRASTRLTVDTRLVRDDDHSLADSLRSGEHGRTALMTELRGALPVGATALLSVADGDGGAKPDRYFELALSRRASVNAPATAPAPPSVELAVVLQDWVTSDAAENDSGAGDASPTPSRRRRSGAGEEDLSPAPPPRKTLQREIAVVDELSVDPKLRLALVVPFMFDGSETRSLAVLVEIAPAADGDEAHAQAFSRCIEEIEHSVQTLAAQTDEQAGQQDWPGFEAAMRAMGNPASRRAALVFLGGQTDAAICQDTALVCDDLLLDQLSRTIVDRASAQTTAWRTHQAMQWLLEFSALELLTTMGNDNRLPAELSAVLSRHAGEVGRHTSTIDAILRSVSTRQDLDRRLVAENFVYLEDSSPAARVRAFDWLAARGGAPPNYDPLASNKDRRAALEAAIDAMQTEANKGVTP